MQQQQQREHLRAAVREAVGAQLQAEALPTCTKSQPCVIKSKATTTCRLDQGDFKVYFAATTQPPGHFYVKRSDNKYMHLRNGFVQWLSSDPAAVDIVPYPGDANAFVFQCFAGCGTGAVLRVHPEDGCTIIPVALRPNEKLSVFHAWVKTA